MNGSATEDDVAVPTSDSNQPPYPPPATDSSPPPLVEQDDDDDDGKVYIVPYGWLREARESSSSGDVDTSTGNRGILYTASSVSSTYRGAMKLINFFNSDLVFSLRREEDSRQNVSKAEVSGRSYALVRTDMWLQALRWHNEPNTAMKGVMNNSLIHEDNVVDTFALNLRISVVQETNTMTVKVSKKDNMAEHYKRASKIFNFDSEVVHIWDFSGQTTLIFMNERNKIHQDCQHHSDQETLLEIHVYGLTESLASRTEWKKEDSANNQLEKVSSHGSSLLCNGRTGDMELDSALCNGHSSISKELDSLGLTGLENLGNTCFMNSAIQCLAHTPKLVEYFLGDYSKEINSQNPLGMDGELALAFGELLRKLWSPERMPVVPKLFKAKLSRFAPQFSGFNQHDSQELLAFLLDGLHEDLNRVKCKRYVEVKDALDRPDQEVADEYWENHLARNSSIIVDICQGQYRSTLVCPICTKISIAFDPFMYLSLPLPSTTMRTMTITVLGTDGITTPSPYTITVPKYGKCKDLIQSLSVACSLRDDESLLLAEVYNNRIIRYLDDLSDAISLVRDEDRLVAYRMVKNEKFPLLVFVHQLEENCFYGKRYLPFGVPLMTKLSDNDVNGYTIQKLFIGLLNPFSKSRDYSIETQENGETHQNGEVADIDISSPLPDCGAAADLGGEGSHSRSELEFYLIDQRGLAMHSKIEMEEQISLTVSQKQLHVLVHWPEEMTVRYDRNLLNSFPEIHTSGSLRKQPQESISLYSCLEAFLKEEPLGPEDMWYCPSCKAHRQASKKLDLWRLPEVLVIHLKRFSYSQFTKNKLETLVDFPIHDLDLSAYVACKNGEHPSLYALYAVSNHYGSMGGGHYTAFVHHAGESRWYDFDDRHVLPISEDSIKTSAAYVLFYKKVQIAAPDT